MSAEAERAGAVRAHAEVRLWGRTAGAVAELESGRVLFEYDPEFRGGGLEISPIHLPLTRKGPVAFDELRRKPAFEGLPGVLADALPDSFGNRVIRAWFAARGEPERALSPVQRLLYMGARALGALTFHPAIDLPIRPAEQESLELAALVRDARRIVAGTPDVAIPEIYRMGASAGGMRPKALVLHDPKDGRIRSGHGEPRAGEIPCLLKFDGVGGQVGSGELGPPEAFNRVEAAYLSLAADAGLAVAQAELLEQGDYAHLLVRRFDLVEGERLHQHSFGGLVHVDYNEPGASSYEEFLRTALALGMPQAAVDEGFRRMVFNVLAVNQDDHVKNLSFHMGPDGRWHLSPAYDLTFARGQGWTRAHQMRVRDRTEGHTAGDLLEVARAFGVKRAEREIERVRAALSRWSERAAEFGVPEATRETIGAALAERRRQLGLG